MAFIFNQRFFQELRQETGLNSYTSFNLFNFFNYYVFFFLTFNISTSFQGIDLENIVYYKDDTHYFVMTAKKQSLLDKGVILEVPFMSMHKVNTVVSCGTPSGR